MKSSHNAHRVKDNLISIILSNLSNSTEFYFNTYTFKDSPDDKLAISRFNNWIKNNKIKSYIVVREYQKRGVLHFHLLKFGEPIQAFWQYGFSDCKIIDSLNDAVQTALYLTKYLTKDEYGNERQVNSKAFTCSKDIKRPVTLDDDNFLDLDEIPDIYFSEKVCIPYDDLKIRVRHQIKELSNCKI